MTSRRKMSGGAVVFNDNMLLNVNAGGFPNKEDALRYCYVNHV